MLNVFLVWLLMEVKQKSLIKEINTYIVYFPSENILYKCLFTEKRRQLYTHMNNGVHYLNVREIHILFRAYSFSKERKRNYIVFNISIQYMLYCMKSITIIAIVYLHICIYIFFIYVFPILNLW